MTNHKKQLSSLRVLMQEKSIAAYIVPANDEFMNEYVPHYARRLEFLTGFTGSAGMVIVLADKAAFFTDGRYTLQAEAQVPHEHYEIINSGDIKPLDWLKENLPKNTAIGLNPMLFSKDNIAKYESVAQLILCDDLIDVIWQDKPEKPISQVVVHAIDYVGVSYKEKINQIVMAMKEQGGEMLLLTAPDSICWLLNIRAGDVENTPLVLARMLLRNNGQGILFIDVVDTIKTSISKYLGNDIQIHALASLPAYLQKISGQKILLDKSAAPYLFFNDLKGRNTIIEATDPCILPKACKNKVEIAGAYNAHLKDGVALTSFLFWLKENYKKQVVTEISVAEKLLEFRSKDNLFVEPSFNTIAGFGSNGAIVHYHASEESNKKITDGNLLLLDSGGQYLNGTTDITRTIAIGTPTVEQKRNFTYVLKGHIAIATAIFPAGTSGHQLDILARQYLWQQGLDYDHGTGHGVGSYLGVHEGPQRISKAPNEIALQPGMIISNEPGYYKNGEYGIRIENLVVVEEAVNHKKFLCFKTLSLVPIDLNLVDFNLLTAAEKQWLIAYHTTIYEKLSGLVEKDVKEWLSEFVSEAGRGL